MLKESRHTVHFLHSYIALFLISLFQTLSNSLSPLSFALWIRLPASQPVCLVSQTPAATRIVTSWWWSSCSPPFSFLGPCDSFQPMGSVTSSLKHLIAGVQYLGSFLLCHSCKGGHGLHAVQVVRASVSLGPLVTMWSRASQQIHDGQVAWARKNLCCVMSTKVLGLTCYCRIT